MKKRGEKNYRRAVVRLMIRNEVFKRQAGGGGFWRDLEEFRGRGVGGKRERKGSFKK